MNYWASKADKSGKGRGAKSTTDHGQSKGIGRVFVPTFLNPAHWNGAVVSSVDKSLFKIKENELRREGAIALMIML